MPHITDGKWINKNGEAVDVQEMSISYIKNVISYLSRFNPSEILIACDPDIGEINPKDIEEENKEIIQFFEAELQRRENAIKQLHEGKVCPT